MDARHLNFFVSTKLLVFIIPLFTFIFCGWHYSYIPAFFYNMSKTWFRIRSGAIIILYLILLICCASLTCLISKWCCNTQLLRKRDVTVILSLSMVITCEIIFGIVMTYFLDYSNFKLWFFSSEFYTHLVLTSIWFFLLMLSKTTEALQTQVEQKVNIISIASTKTNSKAIDLNGTSLFIREGKNVLVYDKQFEKVLHTRKDSLDKIEEKIKKSGWSEGKFRRVSGHLLINQDSVTALVKDSGKNVIYVKGYLKIETEILGQKLTTGIEVPNSTKKIYKKNQQELRDYANSKKI